MTGVNTTGGGGGGTKICSIQKSLLLVQMYGNGHHTWKPLLQYYVNCICVRDDHYLIFPGQVRCVLVCCSNASSVALSESGELYSWGYNGNGQLGVGSNINHSAPCKINLGRVVVKQVR